MTKEKPVLEFPVVTPFSKKIRDFIVTTGKFLAVVATIAAGIIAIYTLLQKDIRGLRINIDANTQIVSVSDTVERDKISILYGGQNIPGLNYLRFQFENSGNKAIRREDIVKKILLDIGKSRKIVDYRYLGKPEINITQNDEHSLSFDFDLLNRDQTFEIAIFAINSEGIPEKQIPLTEITTDTSIVDLENGIEIRNRVNTDTELFNRYSVIKAYALGAGASPVLILLFLILFILFDEYRKYRKNQASVGIWQSGKKGITITLIVLTLILAALSYQIFVTLW